MDLRSYIDSEIEEEEDLGHQGSAKSAALSAGGYPGDIDVYVDRTQLVAENVDLGDTDIGQQAYVARPAGALRAAPAVLVIHENKGLVPYIENVARRLAVRDYVAVAPDLLARVGGTAAFSTPNEVTEALRGLDTDNLVADVRAVVSDVRELDYVAADRVGIVGFCFGGGLAWRVLTEEPRLSAGVPFYGPAPEVEKIPGIQAPVLGIYGELDDRITSGLPEVTAAMAESGKSFKPRIFPGAQHAFHNDTNPDRYNATAAREAWDETVAWLDGWLKADS